MIHGDSKGKMAKKAAAIAAAFLTFYAVYAMLRRLLLQLVEVSGIPQMKIFSVWATSIAAFVADACACAALDATTSALGCSLHFDACRWATGALIFHVVW